MFTNPFAAKGTMTIIDEVAQCGSVFPLPDRKNQRIIPGMIKYKSITLGLKDILRKINFPKFNLDFEKNKHIGIPNP